jgi:hypothetical protein
MFVEEKVMEVSLVRHLGHSIDRKMREWTKGETTSQRKHFEMGPWTGVSRRARDKWGCETYPCGNR